MSKIWNLIVFLLVITAISLMINNNIIVARGEDHSFFIEDPRYSVPVVTLPNNTFNVTVEGDVKLIDNISELFIVAPGYNYTCKYQVYLKNTTTLIVSAKVPGNTIPELYDIYLKVDTANRTIILHEPRSLWVLKKYPSTIKFIHFTDIHIGIRTDNVWAYEFYYSAINLANVLPVNFVVITGDDVDVGSDIASLKLFRMLTNFLRKPSFIIPGNHDHAGVNTATDFEEKYYGKYIGKRYWYRVIGKFLLIGLDTGSYGYLDKTQLQWLEKVLEKYHEKVKIILMHHPLFGYDARGPIVGSWQEFNKIRNLLYPSWREHSNSTKDLLRLIEEYNVTMVLAGHIHTDRVVIYNNKTYFITTTTTCAGRRQSDYRGFRIIEITDTGKVLEYHDPSRNPFKGMSSYNIEAFKTEFEWPNNFTYFINYIAENKDKGWLILNNATIYLYVNKSLSRKEYKIYGNNSSTVFIPYGAYWLVKAMNINIAPGKHVEIIASPFKDNTPPKISMIYYIPRTPLQKSQVTFLLKVNDKGWGVRRVQIIYTYMGENHTLSTYFNGKYWSSILPPLPGAKNTTIIIIAEDYAGNKAISKPILIRYIVPTRTNTIMQTKITNTSPTNSSTIITITSSASQLNTNITMSATSIASTSTPISTSPTTTSTQTPQTTITTQTKTSIHGKSTITQNMDTIDYTAIVIIIIALIVGSTIIYFATMRR